MGDPVGIGLHLAGGADNSCQTLFVNHSDNHAVLLLLFCGHLDAACLAMFVMALMTFFLFLVTFFSFFVAARFFILVAGFLVFGMLAAAFGLNRAIVQAAT